MGGSMMSEIQSQVGSRIDANLLRKNIEEQLKKQNKSKFDGEFNKMKEKLYEFVEEIIESQDEEGEIKNFESFKIETANRKVFRELLEAFTERDEKNHTTIKKLKDMVGLNVQKVIDFDSDLRKVK